MTRRSFSLVCSARLLTYMKQGLGLYELKNLKIEIFHGSRIEFLFVRFILASAPLLQKTILRVDAENVNERQCLNITKELMGFPRASPKLEIICEPSEPGMN
ncbi:hypothetical protein BC332_19212 [Capsicum chinense]|nr:hypothetical protein BC332_19212 [Capsicum chinense]